MKEGAKETLADSGLQGSTMARRLLLEKILPPRRKDFRNINERLPKNKF
jgi:hypothetical protein